MKISRLFYTEKPVCVRIIRIGRKRKENQPMSRGKNFWILLLFLLTGIVLGGFIGTLASGISWLSWLNFGETFGLTEPLKLDFGILVITFGLTIRITMASILGVIIAIFTYRFI